MEKGIVDSVEGVARHGLIPPLELAEAPRARWSRGHFGGVVSTFRAWVVPIVGGAGRWGRPQHSRVADTPHLVAGQHGLAPETGFPAISAQGGSDSWAVRRASRLLVQKPRPAAASGTFGAARPTASSARHERLHLQRGTSVGIFSAGRRTLEQEPNQKSAGTSLGQGTPPPDRRLRAPTGHRGVAGRDPAYSTRYGRWLGEIPKSAAPRDGGSARFSSFGIHTKSFHFLRIPSSFGCFQFRTGKTNTKVTTINPCQSDSDWHE